jgi:hypothetical protein
MLHLLRKWKLIKFREYSQKNSLHELPSSKSVTSKIYKAAMLGSTCCNRWAWNLISYPNRRTQIDDVWEQGAVENIYTLERWRKRVWENLRIEKLKIFILFRSQYCTISCSQFLLARSASRLSFRPAGLSHHLPCNLIPHPTNFHPEDRSSI